MQTSGDSEVILALHRKYSFDKEKTFEIPEGKKLVHFLGQSAQTSQGMMRKNINLWISKLDGVWGFALWNPKIRELILCRDPMGVKPLFRLFLPDGTLLFGSEIKSFYAHPNF